MGVFWVLIIFSFILKKIGCFGGIERRKERKETNLNVYFGFRVVCYLWSRIEKLGFWWWCMYVCVYILKQERTKEQKFEVSKYVISVSVSSDNWANCFNFVLRTPYWRSKLFCWEFNSFVYLVSMYECVYVSLVLGWNFFPFWLHTLIHLDFVVKRWKNLEKTDLLVCELV